MVELSDLRFGPPNQPAFVATAVLDSQLHVVRSWFQYGIPLPNQGK